MFTIWKYPLEITDKQIIHLPIGSMPLSVIGQGHDIYLYVRLNNRRQTEESQFEVYIHGTGHQIDEEEAFNSSFMGTVILLDGKLIFHVFIRRL